VVQLSASIGFAVYPFSPLHPDLLGWEQVSAIADQCAYIAKQNGRNAWVGAYGSPTLTGDDIRVLKKDVSAAVAAGTIGIRTSIYGELKFSDETIKEVL
jgi:hypothetical protein